MDKKTVAEVDSEYFALIMAAHDAAYDKIESPDFVRMLPPPPIRKRSRTLSMRGA